MPGTTTELDASFAGDVGQRPDRSRPFRGARIQAWALVLAFFAVLNGMGVLYWTAELEVSAGLTLLIRALALVVFWKLLEAECAPYRIAFPLDMGFLLYASNFLLLPYYFWRTQRWRGLGKLLAIVGIWLATYAGFEVVAWLIVPE